MANINKIQLPSGAQYDIEDAVARGKSVMVVTITGEEDAQSGDVNYSADKTFAEISAHIQGGGYVVAKDNYNMLYKLQYFSDYEISFSEVEIHTDHSSLMVAQMFVFTITNDDEVTMYSENIVRDSTTIVNIQKENNELVADKSYNEIIEDLNNKKYVICALDSTVTTLWDWYVTYLPFERSYGNSLVFRALSSYMVGRQDSAAHLGIVEAHISSNNTVAVDINMADIPQPSSTAPLADGTAAVGTSTDYARADHVHPVSSLSALSDTTITNPADGQVLTYDSTTGKWVNAAADASFDVQIVQTLPTTNIDTHTIYFVPVPAAVVGTAQVGSSTVGSENDVYDEYMYINNQWEKIGDTRIDLSGYATEDYVDAAIVQSDWDEDDSADPAYVQNRTHYRTSLGYVLPIDIKDLYDGYLYEDNYSLTEINKTYSYSTSSHTGNDTNLLVLYPDYFNTAEAYDGFPNINKTGTPTISINGTAQNLTFYYAEDSDRFYGPTLYAYNDNYCIVIEPYTHILVYSNSNTSVTSIVFNLPMVNEIFEYTKKLDSNFLDGRLIASGEGINSEIFNGITGKRAAGDYSHIEGVGYASHSIIVLSGSAGATEYSYSNIGLSSYAKYPKVLSGLELYIQDSETYEMIGTGSIIEAVDDNYLYLNKTLDSENNLNNSNFYVNIASMIAGYGAHAEGNSTWALGLESHSEGSETVALGDASHAEGSSTTASRSYSHSEGSNTIASGNSSHSEGSITVALGDASHAEGSMTTAYGIYSHSEGSKTIASGNSSHSEGSITTVRFRLYLTGDANATTYTVNSCTNLSGVHPKMLIGATINDKVITSVTYTGNTPQTVTLEETLSTSAISNKSYYTNYLNTEARGNYSHAEGAGNVAVGVSSHVEGYISIANGNYSHGEGVGTIASSAYQHVQGKYNVEDSNNTYADIVGNGTSSARSNAYTLDWSGNGWYAGKVSAGTTASPAAVTNANDLTTKAYVDTAIGASIPTASTTLPVVDGTAAIGSSSAYAKADHVHPTDTSRAPVNSPALTGTPTAPTAAAGTNTTQIATTQFVNSAVSSALTSVMTYKGTKATVVALPSSGNAVGDVWHVTANGSEYAWDGSTWQELGTTDKEVMVVYPTDINQGSYTFNKTFSEISSHLNNGGIAILLYTSGGTTNVYEVGVWDSSFIGFTRSIIYSAGEPGEEEIWFDESSFSIYPNNTGEFYGGTNAVLSSGANLNGNFTSFPTFYAPTSAGTSGYVLTSSGSGAPTWQQPTAVPSASSTAPLADGTAAVGSSTAYARADHVHPSDSTKANVTDVLTKTNTTAFTPTADYQPATKKYVDDHSGVTYQLSMTNNVITLTGSDSSTSSVTLPVFNGSMSPVVTGGGS